MKLIEYIKFQKINTIGLHYAHLRNIINGRRRPSPKLALRIEKATNGLVTVEELLYPNGELEALRKQQSATQTHEQAKHSDI